MLVNYEDEFDQTIVADAKDITLQLQVPKDSGLAKCISFQVFITDVPFPTIEESLFTQYQMICKASESSFVTINTITQSSGENTLPGYIDGVLVAIIH